MPSGVHTRRLDRRPGRHAGPEERQRIAGNTRVIAVIDSTGSEDGHEPSRAAEVRRDALQRAHIPGITRYPPLWESSVQ